MEDIIEKKYYESVKGLSQKLLDDGVAWYHYVLDLPIEQQIVYTVVLFHSQIENGGFHQYFFNPYGQFAYLALKNLILIGAMQRADLLKRALSEVNAEKLNEGLFRDAVFNRNLKSVVSFDKDLFEHFDRLDNEYYNIEDENIDQLLDDYLQKKSS